MLIETCILVGLLVAVAVYLILQPGFVRILFGFVLLSNAINLLVLLASGEPRGRTVPIVGEAVDGLPPVDPLPQALVLTAIVIGFGVIAYLVVLLYRTFLDQGTADAGELFAEAPEDHPTASEAQEQEAGR
jgi:multicomponent Na+:H+ antiporter subunit C